MPSRSPFSFTSRMISDQRSFTPVPASKISVPLVKECPVNIECKTRHRLDLGMHTMFIGEAVAVHADEDILDEKGVISLDKFKPLAPC